MSSKQASPRRYFRRHLLITFLILILLAVYWLVDSVPNNKVFEPKKYHGNQLMATSFLNRKFPRGTPVKLVDDFLKSSFFTEYEVKNRTDYQEKFAQHCCVAGYVYKYERFYFLGLVSFYVDVNYDESGKVFSIVAYEYSDSL